MTAPADLASNDEHAERSDRATMTGATYEMMLDDLRPQLPRIAAPVLVIAPAPDAATAPQFTAYYTQQYAGTAHLDVVPIAPSKHFVMFDQPQKFRDALDAFVAAHGE